jgi:hypothetical protein
MDSITPSNDLTILDSQESDRIAYDHNIGILLFDYRCMFGTRNIRIQPICVRSQLPESTAWMFFYPDPLLITFLRMNGFSGRKPPASEAKRLVQTRRSHNVANDWLAWIEVNGLIGLDKLIPRSFGLLQRDGKGQGLSFD